LNQSVGQIGTALRGAGIITQVMVAAHKIKLRVQFAGNKREVFRWQIAAGKNQVDVCKLPSIKLIMQDGLNPI
jgi:hypothetical protein